MGDRETLSGAGADPAQETQDFLAKVRRLEWLRDECVRATLVCSSPRLFFGVSCEDQNRQLSQVRIAPDLIQDLPSIHDRESNVQHDEIGMLGANSLEAAGTVLSHDEIQAGRAQAHFDETPNDAGIFYN